MSNEQDDEAAIRHMVFEAVRRFNQGDPTVIQDLWASDADYVGVNGVFIHGRDAIARLFTSMLGGKQQPQQTANIDQVRFLTPDLAVVDASWKITGARGASGRALPPIDGRGLEVVVRMDGKWRFVMTREMIPWRS